MDACEPAREWLCSYAHASDAWCDCPRGDWLLWLAGTGGVDRRLVVLAACDCARLALSHVPEGDLRPLRAIEAGEAWARGQSLHLRASYAYAYADAVAAYAASSYARYAASASYASASYAFYATAATDAASYAACAAAYAATADATAARAASLAACADLVRARIPAETMRVALVRWATKRGLAAR